MIKVVRILKLSFKLKFINPRWLKPTAKDDGEPMAKNNVEPTAKDNVIMV